MKVVSKRYKLLNGQEKKLLSAIGDGRVIRLFDKTEYPTSESDVVCPHFYELACLYGCMYDCSWCYLKGTFRFLQQPDGRIPVKFKKENDIVNAVDTFLRLDLPGVVLNTGELGDSLAAETKFYGCPFSVFLMRRFVGTRHKVLFLTKGTYIKNFLQNFWQKNAILSWSLNAYPVAQRWEKLAPHPLDRIAVAKEAAESGYEVRLRIDPMVAVDNFEEHYRRLVDDIFQRLTPSRITLGCLRGLAATIARAKDKSWLPYLAESSNWGRKPPIEVRLKLYANIIEHLKDNYKYRNIAVCKDTVAIWRWLKAKYGLDYGEMKCNCNNSLAGAP